MKRPVDLGGFVNIHGEPIRLTASHTQKPKPKAAPVQTAIDGSPTGRHLGWQAVGFSPEAIKQAGLGKKEFDPESWMNGAQPKGTKPTPYATPSAAAQCAEMLRKAGWKRVSVVEVIRP